MISQASLTSIADKLNSTARDLGLYESAVGAQLTAMTAHLGTVRQSWDGPLPVAVGDCTQAWLDRVRGTTDAIRSARGTVSSWAAEATQLARTFPPNDPNRMVNAELEEEVRANWMLICGRKSTELSGALTAIRGARDVDVSRDLYSLRDLFTSVGGGFWPGAEWLPGTDRWWVGPTANPFATQMTGTGPNQKDLDMARLCQDVGNVGGWNDPYRTVANGWRRVTEAELPPGLSKSDFENNGANNGLRAALYTDGNGNFTVAFAGSEDKNDWLVANPGQAFGYETPQYRQALELGRKLKSAYGNNIVATGHSLGGGVASYVALGAGMPGVTFNAAGLSDASMIRATGMPPDAARAQAANGQVRRITTGATSSHGPKRVVLWDS